MDTYNSNDPANVAAVSGFYGPGAWAAWLCSLTSAWYTLLLHPEAAGSSDLIVTLLYTNWAAIELLKQLYQGTQNVSQASLGAAATVTLWGWCHNVLQIQVCLLFVPRSSASRRRAFFALSGVFIPTLATLWIVSDTFLTHGTWVTPPFPKRLPRDELVFWYKSSHDLVATILGLIFHVTFLVLVSDMYWITKRGLYATAYTHCFLGMFALAIHNAYRISPGFVRPCSPQNIREADQAFAVLCGLVALVYQIGPDVWHRTGPDLWNGSLQCYPYEQQKKVQARQAGKSRIIQRVRIQDEEHIMDTYHLLMHSREISDI